MNEDKSKQIPMMPTAEMIFHGQKPIAPEVSTQTIILGHNDLNAPKVTEEEYQSNVQAVVDLFEDEWLHRYIK